VRDRAAEREALIHDGYCSMPAPLGSLCLDGSSGCNEKVVRGPASAPRHVGSSTRRCNTRTRAPAPRVVGAVARRASAALGPLQITTSRPHHALRQRTLPLDASPNAPPRSGQCLPMAARPVVLILSRRRWPCSGKRPFHTPWISEAFVSAWNTQRARNLHCCGRDFQVALSTTFSGDELRGD
jgi:hypothetical protein